MTTTVDVKRQKEHTNALLCSDPPKSRSDVAADPRDAISGPFPSWEGFCFFLASLMT
jgi:hypothetical protein